MERLKQWQAAQHIFMTLAIKELGDKHANEIKILSAKYEGIVKPLLTQLDQIESAIYKTKPDVEPLSLYLNKYSSFNAQLKTKSALMINAFQTIINGLKDADATKKSNLVRAYKVLKTTLDALVKSCDSWLGQETTILENKGKVKDVYQQLAREFMAVLRAALARGLAAAQRIKASPTPQVYNGEMMKAARDIFQQIGNVKKLAGKGYAVPGPADPTSLSNLLNGYANGPLDTVKEGTAPKDILGLVSQFNKIVKTVADAYDVH